MFIEIPRQISKEGLESSIHCIDAWKEFGLDGDTLEAATEAINVLLAKVKAEGDFMENSFREQRETITRLEERIKDAEKDKMFLKDIITALIERRY